MTAQTAVNAGVPRFDEPPVPVPGWRLGWLTPTWCRTILFALLIIQVFPRLLYLHSPDALGLAPDEAQYWVWSQQLDWSYYSKGPMVAVLIRISTDLFGDTMPAVRYPAIVIGVGMTLMTYWLTRRLFGSERLALGAVGLNFFVPMFIAGSMLMTIDPPFVFFWTAATCLFCKALFGGRAPTLSQDGVSWAAGGKAAAWAWPAAGLMVGMSFLAKYASFFLFAGLVLGMLADRELRRRLLSPGPYVALLVAAACTFPVVYWNWKNGWVSAKHVQADTTSGFKWTQPLEFFGGQMAVVGPLLTIILIAAVLYTFRGRRNAERQSAITPPPVEAFRRARFLVLTVTPYAVVVFGSSFVTNAQLNWTAPMWFASLIVGAWFLSTRLADVVVWKKWRGLLWGTVAFGLVLMPLAHNIKALYPVFAWVQTNLMGKQVRVQGDEVLRATMTPDERKRTESSVRRWDPTARLQGWRELAADLDKRRRAVLGDDAFILSDDYAESAALEFYTAGHPRTFVLGPYVEDPKRRGRTSQWDIWPDRSIERGKTQLLGKNAIYIGTRWKVLDDSFDRVEQLHPVHEVTVFVGGVGYYLGGYRVWACYGFKGMVRPTDGVKAW